MTDQTHLHKLARMLQTDVVLLEKLLTCQSIAPGGKSLAVDVQFTSHQSFDARDALAKALYSQLFKWLVARISGLSEARSPIGSFSRSVGVLDTFGFENLSLNSLEQLCINYANEKMQKMFARPCLLIDGIRKLMVGEARERRGSARALHQTPKREATRPLPPPPSQEATLAKDVPYILWTGGLLGQSPPGRASSRGRHSRARCLS